MKEKKTINIRKIVMKIVITVIMINMMSVNVLAAGIMATADVDTILNPVKLLQTLFFAIIALIGLILVGKGILELMTAIPQRDGTSIKEAALYIAGGVIGASISTVLAFLGLSA